MDVDILLWPARDQGKPQDCKQNINIHLRNMGGDWRTGSNTTSIIELICYFRYTQSPGTVTHLSVIICIAFDSTLNCH